jgi:hypothetical protein
VFVLITPQEALPIIEEKYIEILEKCSNLEERLDKLMELFPESIFWSPLPARWLVYQLHLKYGLDFGVCKFYSFEDDDQYCSVSGLKCICTCVIPQKDCVARDRYSEPGQRCPGKYGKSKHCRGTIEKEKPLSIVINGEEREVFACSKCRRLYFDDGKPVVNESGAQARLITEYTGAFLFDT